MVYSYLLDLYKHLEERTKAIGTESQAAVSSGDTEKLEYLQGRLAAVETFKEFLVTNYHHKLPRRLQKNGK